MPAPGQGARTPAAPRAFPAWRSMDYAAHSCEEILCLDQSLRQAVDLLARIVKRKGGAAGCSHTETGKERHDAVGARAHGNTCPVDDGGNIVRMSALHLK